MDVMPDSTAVAALTAAYDVIRQPLGAILPRLSEVLAATVPHRAAAELSTHCAHSPLKTHGDPGLTTRITTADLAPLLASGVPGRPWQGALDLAGAEHPVLTVTSDATPAARCSSSYGRTALPWGRRRWRWCRRCGTS